MVTLNYAYSGPINPPDASPILSQAQVWAGLQRKIRNAQEFVPVITSCTVISDEGEAGPVTREVTFGPGGPVAAGEKLREVVRSYKPLKVDFEQPDGGLVCNLISAGPSGAPTDLWMTYSFQWMEEVGEEGSEEVRVGLEKGNQSAKMAVEKSIETIRTMVREGKI